MNELSPSIIQRALDWAYENAVTGIPGLGTAAELAEDYAKGHESTIEQANALIRWQVAKCATSGFVTGLGGAFTLPVAIPANITTVLYVQVRMIAALAHLGGHDLKDDRVKTLVYAALTGTATVDVLKDVGIKLGAKLTENIIKGISRETITKINKAVGLRLLTKFGSTGIINLGKLIPVVSGIIGGSIDGFTTRTIGNVARDLFLSADTSEFLA